MKNIFLFLCLCLILSSCDQLRQHQPSDAPICYAQLRPEANYWDSIPGKVKVREKYRRYRYYLNNDLYTGKVMDTTPSGRLKLTGAFKEGYQEGPWIYYHLNGTPDAVGSYENGYVSGEWKCYDNRGQENARLLYKRHERDIATDTLMVVYRDGCKKEWLKDSMICYYPNGNKKYEMSRDGSTGTFWDINGPVLAEMKEYIKKMKFTDQTIYYVASGKHKVAYDALLKSYHWSDKDKDLFAKADVVTTDPVDRFSPKNISFSVKVELAKDSTP